MSVPLSKRLPLYVGGFMGPFGTIVIIPMFPELREEFSATSSQVNLGYSLYLVPFALLLLVSGTLAERWGRRRTIRGTYLLFAVASVVAALAPNLTTFVAARAMQGVANAFITPILIAGLAELVPENRLGREVGIYSSFQALGGGLAPVIGGIAADTSWQLAFWGTVIVSLALASQPPEGEPRSGAAASGLNFRALLTKRIVALGIAFFFAAAGPIGVSVLVGIAARDVLDLSGTVTGVVLLAGSMSALVTGPYWGRLLDRHSIPTIAPLACALITLLAVLPAFAAGAVSLAVLWIVVSAVTGFVVVTFQNLGATLLPENRGGALSFLLAFRFLGHAVGPLIFVPFVVDSIRPTFVAAAALGVITVALVVRHRTVR